jgi:hypothetical protein
MYPLVSSNAALAGVRVSSHMPVTISTMLCTSRWPPRRALSTRFGELERVRVRVRIVVLAAAGGLGISLAVRIFIGTVVLSPVRWYAVIVGLTAATITITTSIVGRTFGFPL